MSLVRAAARDHLDVQGAVHPTPHWMWSSGELTPSLTVSSTRESGLCTSLKQPSGAGPDGRGMGEPAQLTYTLASRVSSAVLSSQKTGPALP